MQNYQHPNIPEFKATIDKDGSYSVFLREKKALEEVSKQELKHMGFQVEEDRSQKIVIPIGVAGEDIKTGQCVQLCDLGIVLKYRHGKQVEQEEKRDDWKLDLYESLEGLFGKGLDELEEFLAFRKKLETHIPKQKKFTNKYILHEIKSWLSKITCIKIDDISNVDKVEEYTQVITKFLSDHDLLEE